MKYIAFLLLSSLTALGADFLTGQAARITIGQSTFTSQDTGSPSAYQIGAVGGVAYANNSLFVVDSNHIQATPVLNRVLIYNNISRYILPPTSPVPQGVRCPVCVGSPEVGGADIVLGQPDFSASDVNVTANGFRTPTAVATDGRILAVADTDNNRVLIWNSIPAANNTPANVVLGQADFNTTRTGLNSSSFRGPQGVWIQGTRLFVADTQNHRVLIWNSIPTSNNKAADLVLGEPNFNTAPPATQLDLPAQANNLFSPVSVTSDGQRLFVTDLAHNRVLIWNSIPGQNQQPADVVIGQPDMTSEVQNNAPKLCASNGTDSDNKPTYPARCGATLSFPRFALSDGTRLFVADGGNDRVLIYNTIPTQNGLPANTILGQPDEFTDQVTDTGGIFVLPDANVLSSSPNTFRSPMALAWDGTNLYVADPYDRRVLAFTIALPNVPLNGITNSASQSVYAVGAVNLGGTITADDTVTITIKKTSADTGIDYKYTVVKDDTLAGIVLKIVDLINGKTGGTPDPNVLATANPGFNQVILTSRIPGPDGNNINYSGAAAAATTTATPTIQIALAGSALTGGTSAAVVAPGTLVTITGTNLSDTVATATPTGGGYYPTTLAGVEVYFDGIKAPLLYVSPNQINTQIPFEVSDSNGVSTVVRTVHNNGLVTSTNAISVPVVLENPGIFADQGSDPRTAIAYHTSSNGSVIVDIQGQINSGDTATITIDTRSYTYTIQSTDTLAIVRDGLVAQINANPEERVRATPTGQYTRILLTAKVPGPDGNGIAVAVASTTKSTTGATVTLATLGGSATCCASAAGTRITPDNPAVPGEIITIYAAGLGLSTLADGVTTAGVTGQVYVGPAFNVPETPVDNAQVGGLTANVVSATLVPGMLAVYEIRLQLSSDLPSNPNTQVYIAQSFFTSNIVTIPVVSPVPVPTQ